jgi:hypothetical protein
VVVDNLDVIGVPVAPNKTNTPLVINAYAVLPFTLTMERFQTIAGRCRKVTQFRRTIQLPKLPASDGLDGLKSTTPLTSMKPLGFRAAERINHSPVSYTV